MRGFLSGLTALCILLGVVSAAQAAGKTIRFGVLPVLDTLPLHVAVQDGLFAAQGLDVQLVPFASALERDVAAQAGQLDGYFGDMVAAFMLIENKAAMPVALVSYRTRPDFPMFGIVTSPGKSGATLDMLRGATIGISRSTIIEYLLDRMEEKGGLGPGYFKRMDIKKLPIRLQMLAENQIDLALLPEPLLSLNVKKGGTVVYSDGKLGIPLTVLCLHERFFKDDGGVFRAFTQAYRDAVNRLAANAQSYRQLMTKACSIPGPLVETFPVYPYPLPERPTRQEVDEVQDWMLSHGLLQVRIPYERAVAPLAP